jgi:integrase
MNRQRSILDDILDRSNFSPTTRKQYERVIGDWLEFAGAHPKGWTRLQAQGFYAELLSRGVKLRTASTYMASLRYVSKWFSVQHGGEDFAIIQMQEAPVEKADRRALAQDEVEAMLATCEGKLPIGKRPVDRRDRTMLIVGLETGMRTMSLAGMQIENISTKPYPCVKVPIKGKGGKATFEVPLSDTAMLALRDWNGWLRTQGVKDGPVFAKLTRSIQPNGFIKHSPGSAISLVRIYQIIDERAEEAEIKHVHPHLLRNTFITWRLLAGLNAPQIASVTGHQLSSIAEFGGEWKNMTPYFDLKAIGETARQATPPWFATHVRNLVEKD